MMLCLFRRLAGDEVGQDLIEYALLTSFVGLLGIASINLLTAALQNVYNSWTGQTNNIYQSPNPSGS
jgi:Flp pilus assembly pilin Flp